MKLSRRALRMERHHRRRAQVPPLNIVSLMDIFTLLVFFLLLSSGDVQELASSKSVHLPESISDAKAHPNLTITVNDKDIIVDGRAVVTVAEALAGGSDVIKSLHTELLLQAQRSVRTTADGAAGRHVVIMGDKQIPYRLLKKIMVTCTEANYNHFALAVLHKSGGNS